MNGQDRHGGAPALAAGGRPLLMLPLLALLAVAMALGMYAQPPPAAGLVVAGGLAATGILVLALVRYDAAVALGVLLLAVVPFDPGPPDLVFAIIIAVAIVTGRFESDRVPFVITALLAALLAINLASSLDATDPGRAFSFFVITLYLVILGIWFAGFVSSTERARLVVVAYLAAALLSAAAASLAVIAPFPGHEAFLVEDGLRAKGLYQDPNVYAPFLIPIALILLQEILEPRLLRIPVFFKLLALLVLAAGILLAFSRGAWLNAVVGAFVMLVVILVRRGGLRRVPALLGILMLVAATLPAVIVLGNQSQFLEQRSERQAYDSDRFGAQRTGIELAEEHPLGIGPGQFEVASPVASHSIYVRVLAEQGVLGLAILVALIGATLLYATRNAFQGRDTYGIGSAALLGALCGVLANSLVIDSLHWRHFWLLLALIWAGSMASSSRANDFPA